METTQHFAHVEKAMLWLNNHSELWAGLTESEQDGIYQMLDEEGRACVRTPAGDVFIAIID